MTDERTDAALSAEVDRQKGILLRGTVDLISEADLGRKLQRSIATGRPLRIKLGVDPTASVLHLGFTVVLNKLRAFQDLGHTAVLIIGDATALVGDPTGRNRTRPRLTQDEVAANSAWWHDRQVVGFPLYTPSPWETLPRIGNSPPPTYTMSGFDSLTAIAPIVPPKYRSLTGCQFSPPSLVLKTPPPVVPM